MSVTVVFDRYDNALPSKSAEHLMRTALIDSSSVPWHVISISRNVFGIF